MSKRGTKLVKRKSTAKAVSPAKRAAHVERATYQHEQPALADDLELDVVGFETLGDASVLHLEIGGGRMSLAIEPAPGGERVTSGAIVVPSARDGNLIINAIARWLSQPAPARPLDALDPPPPSGIGLIELQRGTNDDGRTWQRTKLCFGVVEELYLIWETSGLGAWLSEKDGAVRKALLVALAYVVRDGVPLRRPVDTAAVDPLRQDPVPLVTSLLRVPVGVTGFGKFFWRGGRYHVLENLGNEGTAVVAIATDGTFERIATIPERTRYICASGPHIVATVERRGENRELWIIGPGESTARLLLRDPDFEIQQMCDVVCSADGAQIAVTGSEHGELRTRILAPDGALLETTDETYPERWEHGRFIYATPARRFELHATPKGEIAIVDHVDDTTRVIAPTSVGVRELLLEFQHVLENKGRIVAGTCFTLELLGDLLLIDGVTLKTWSIMPNNYGYRLTIDDAFAWIAVKSSGGLLLGQIGDRWRTGAVATESNSVVRERLAMQIEGDRFTFDGQTTTVQVDVWANRLGVARAEIVRRLDATGRQRLAAVHAKIGAALAVWGTDADAAAHDAARVPISGAASSVWSAMRHRKPEELDERERTNLGEHLRRLAAQRYASFLQSEQNVAVALAATDAT